MMVPPFAKLLATGNRPVNRRGAGYRVEQFIASLWPRVLPAERAMLARFLSPQALALFCRMPRRDQRHCLDVYYAVQAAGGNQTDLLIAALLHDVGKTTRSGRRLRLWHRVLIVLLNAIAPALVQQLARPRPASWGYPFFVHLHHPERGAELALAAGCSNLTAALIRRHQATLAGPPEDDEDRLLALLQAADDAN